MPPSGARVGRAGAEPLPVPAEPGEGSRETGRDVPTPRTMQLGSGDTLVAAEADFDDSVSGAEIEAASDDAERRLRRRYPGIRYVFPDPARGTAGRNHRDGGVDL